MRIRRATTGDWEDIGRIRMSVRENPIPDLSVLDLREAERMIGGRDGAAWVAEVNGRIVGFARADLSNANVYALFVEPEFESNGIGRRLHDTMLDWFFSAGAGRVWLSTDPATRAESFYTRAGWIASGTEENGETRFEMPLEWWLRDGRPGRDR